MYSFKNVNIKSSQLHSTTDHHTSHDLWIKWQYDNRKPSCWCFYCHLPFTTTASKIHCSLSWCSFIAQQRHLRSGFAIYGHQQATVQISLQCLYKTLGFLSGDLVHSSKKTKLSIGWSGVNFTAGRIRTCDCTGLLHYPWHAYSVAWALGGHRGRESERSMMATKSRTFHVFLSPSSLWSALFLSLSFCLFPLAHLSPL